MIGVGVGLDLGWRREVGVTLGAVLPLRALAANGAIPTGKATVDAGVTMVRTRTRHRVLAASGVIAAQWPLFQTTDSSGGIEQAVTWPEGTTFKASVEVTGSTGGTASPTLVRLAFAGQTTWTAPAGGASGGLIASDELPAGAFGLTQFAAGDTVYLKTEIVFPTAGTGQHPLADGSGGGGANAGEACYYGGTGSVDLTGPLASQGASAQTTRIAKPLVVLGRHNGVALLGIGDSNGFGKGVATPNGDGLTAGSWMAMAAAAAGLPLTKVAISGDRAAAFTAARRPQAIALAAYHTHALLGHGTNDVGAGVVSSGMGDLLAAELDALRLVNPAIAGVVAEVMIRCSSSSDSWATVAGQTVQSGWTAGTRRDPANASIAALVGTRGVVAKLPSFDGATSDGGDPRKWLTNGSASYATGDGTHCTQVIASAIGTSAAAVLQQLTVAS